MLRKDLTVDFALGFFKWAVGLQATCQKKNFPKLFSHNVNTLGEINENGGGQTSTFLFSKNKCTCTHIIRRWTLKDDKLPYTCVIRCRNSGVIENSIFW